MKLKRISLIIVFLSSYLSYASLNSKIDLLKDSIQNTNNSNSKIHLYLKLSEVFINQNLDTSYFYASEALKLAEELKNNEQIIESSINIANIYKYRGHFQEAIALMSKALQLINKKEEKELLAKCLYSLGELNRASKQYESAIYYINEAKEIYTSSNNIHGTAKAYNRLAAILLEQLKFEEALDAANSSIILLNNGKDSALLANNYEIIGAMLRETGKRTQALQYFENASRINKSINNEEGFINNLINIGATYHQLKKYNEAISYLKEAYTLSLALNIKVYQATIADILSRCYKEKGDFELAYNFLDSNSRIKFELFYEKSDANISEINSKFLTERKEHENEVLTKENELKNNVIKKQRILVAISIVFSVIIALMGLLFLKNRQQTQKDKIKLNDKNRKIKEHATELRETNEKLLELTQFKEKLTNMLVYSLKNPLNNIINISSSYSPAKQIKTVKQAGIYMMNIVNDLLDVNRFENSKLILARSIFLLDEVIESAIEQVEILMLQKNLRLKNKIEENYQLKMDRNIFERVIINLLINAIRYSPQNAEIEIGEENQGNNFKLIIKDYGPGIPKHLSGTFFDLKEQLKTQTHDKRGGGLGIAFCKIAVEAHGGTIGFNSKPGESTEFWVILPLSTSDEVINKRAEIFGKKQKELIDISGKTILKPFVFDLNKYNVYEVSQIRNVLKKIDAYDNFKIKAWKSEIDDAIYNCNEERYKELVNLILK